MCKNEKGCKLGFALVLGVSPFLMTGNASAEETNEQLTEEYQVMGRRMGEWKSLMIQLILVLLVIQI